MPTTSSTSTAARPTSRPGGTWSTGTRSPSASPKRRARHTTPRRHRREGTCPPACVCRAVFRNSLIPWRARPRPRPGAPFPGLGLVVALPGAVAAEPWRLHALEARGVIRVTLHVPRPVGIETGRHRPHHGVSLALDHHQVLTRRLPLLDPGRQHRDPIHPRGAVVAAVVGA